MDPRIRPFVERIWRYHQLNHELAPADAIVVLCSHDTSVAGRGAELLIAGWAPLLVFSGGLGGITRTMWQEPEAHLFARLATEMGAPADRILIENRSTNTGENVQFTRRLLESRGIAVQRLMVVQKPYMERRSYATFKKIWPEPELIVTSPRASLDEYLRDYSNQSLSTDEVISIMVGDLQRIRVYADRGFQIPQPMPDDVWEAFEVLVAAGFGGRLIE
jgi:uncharacterized SAM-binding protein YcdF (DUF218 family)